MEKVDIYKVTYEINVPHLNVYNMWETSYVPYRHIQDIMSALQGIYTEKVEIIPGTMSIEPTNIRDVYFPDSIKNGNHKSVQVVKFVKRKYIDMRGWRLDKTLFRILANDYADAYKIVSENEGLKALLPDPINYTTKYSLVGVSI